jgi:hypothetical protein
LIDSQKIKIGWNRRFSCLIFISFTIICRCISMVFKLLFRIIHRLILNGLLTCLAVFVSITCHTNTGIVIDSILACTTILARWCSTIINIWNVTNDMLLIFYKTKCKRRITETAYTYAISKTLKSTIESIMNVHIRE